LYTSLLDTKQITSMTSLLTALLLTNKLTTNTNTSQLLGV